MSTLGKLLVNAHYPEAAQYILEKALEVDPHWPAALYQMGMAHMELVEFEKAEPFFRRVSELSPNDAVPTYMLGLAEQLLDRPEEAMATYQAALKIDPEFLRPRWGMAGLQYERHDFLSAIDNLKMVLAAEPDHAKSLAMLGKCYVGLARGGEAIPYFKKALELEPFLEDVAEELATLEAAKRN
jgi:tetratricopeptide (TPR) repeat protein